MVSENAAGAVYGVIVVGSLLAAEGSRGLGYLEVIGSVVLALILYWLAHAYAASLGHRLDEGRGLAWMEFRKLLVHEWALVRGALLPLVVLCIAGLAGVRLETAMTASLVTCAVSLLGLELVAGVGRGLSALEVLVEGCIGAALGIGLLGLKILLH